MTLYSIVDARGTGGYTTLATPPYLLKEHIYVYVDGLPTTAFEWVGDTAVRLIAPINRLIRVVRRTSPGVLLTAYQDGTQLPGATLTVDSKQAFYMAQEALDLAMLAGGSGGGSVPPGVELTQQGIKDLLLGQITPSELELSLREEIERISGTEEVIGSVAWKILQEAIARTAAIQAEAAARAAALLQEAAERGAAITVETTSRQSAVESLASQITTLTAAHNSTLAAVQTEVTARTNADGALATSVTTVATAAANASAAVVTEATARSNADNAIASSIEAIRADLVGEDTAIRASVTTEVTARVNADNALSSRVTSLETSVGGSGGTSLSSRVTTVEQAISNETSARATAISSLDAAYKSADTTINASITAANTARADADTALATRASVLEAKVDPTNIPSGKTVMSLIADEATVRSSADATNATAISSVQSSITGSGGISPRLAAVETSAATSVSELGTVKSNYTIKVQARSDGKLVMAGIGLNATIPASGPAQSELVFLADKMTFVPDMSGLNVTPQPLFVVGVVDGVTTFVMPKQRLGDSLIESRMIVDGTIEGRHIKADTITASKIDSRGLTIKDAYGNVLFGAGTGVDWSVITGVPSLETPSGAQAKANAAAAAAQSAAQTYAAAQAAAADVSARAHADGIVTAAEAAAIAEATSLANAARAAAEAAAAADATAKANAAAVTAVWSGVSGSGKPADGATVGATIGSNLYGAYTQTSWDTYMTSAFIRSSHIQNLSANQIVVTTGLSDISPNVGLLRNASSGGRQEIESNRTRIFDASNNLRAVFGYLL